MHRRDFIKKIVLFSLSFVFLKTKIMAKSLFKPFNLEDGIFVNNYVSHRNSFKDFWRWRMESKKPQSISFPIANNNPEYLKSNKSERTITWVGHSTFLLQIDSINILTDPHFTKRASPLGFVGPKRTTPPGLKIEDLPFIDFVLISHNHYDHLDSKTIQLLLNRQNQNQPTFFVPLKLKKTISKLGAKNIFEHEWWQMTKFKDLEIHSVPVQHWSKRTVNDTNKTLWCGWVIQANNFKYFFPGDTGYSQDFQDIQKKFGTFDLVTIPIGAYAPRWFMKDTHCNVEEAIKIHKDIKSKKSIAMHWGTFQLTDEPMDEPIKLLQELSEKFKLEKDEFIHMTHGETIKI